MLQPYIFMYYCKAKITFSILLFIVDSHNGTLYFYSDALCLNAAEALLPRHSYAASTPFLRCFYAILTTLLRHSYKTPVLSTQIASE